MYQRARHGVGVILSVFSLGVMASLLQAASPEDLEKALSLNESAIRKIRGGDHDGAELDLLQALEFSGQDEKLKKNLGAVYYEKGAHALNAKKDFHEAERYFRKALETQPQNARYQKGLAAAIFLEAGARAGEGRSDDALELYEKAAELDASNLRAWVRACEFAWATQKLEKAARCLEKAKALSPDDPQVRILEERLAKAAAESRLSTETSEHFILSAEPEHLDGAGSHRLLVELEEAYNEVSYRLSFQPRQKIAVVFYPRAEFHGHLSLPSRVRGLYDGKLRIPYVEAGQMPDRGILRHEIAHAFISAAAASPIPRWLNEGLAQWAEGKKLDWKSKDALLMLEASRRVPDAAHLDGVLSESRNPYNDQAMTAAAMKALSLTDYLVEEHGAARVFEFIRAFRGSESADAQFKVFFQFSLKETEAQWRSWLPRKKG